MISMIAAVGANGVIGRNNALPWHLPADLAYFKKVTMGHAVVMGRKTFESIGKPLPGRYNIILTRDKSYRSENCIIMHTVEEILEYSRNRDVFIIGGAEVYKSFIDYADKLYITWIDESFDGDAFFPEIDENKWYIISRSEWERDASNGLRFCFMVYRNRHSHGADTTKELL